MSQTASFDEIKQLTSDNEYAGQYNQSMSEIIGLLPPLSEASLESRSKTSRSRQHENRNNVSKTTMIEYAKRLIFTEGMIEYRSCRDRCGVSYLCSCKPICKIFKTCCWDFEESCGTMFNVTNLSSNDQNELLRPLEYKCVNNVIAVASCSFSNGAQHLSLPEVAEALPYSDSTDHMSNATSNSLSISQVFEDLLANAEKGLLPLGSLERTLWELPVTDISTGIPYRNISMYVCNGANLNFAVPWQTRFHDVSAKNFAELQIIYTSKVYTSVFSKFKYEGAFAGITKQRQPCFSD